jgi:ribosomal protein S18 acetylase RimI-like enzyme
MMIRSFRNSDLNRIVEFKHQSVKVSFPGLDFDDKLFRKALLNSGPGSVMVAEDNGTVIGYIFLKTKKTSTGKYGIIHHVFVDPDYRGRGIATTLMKKAEDHFRSLGLRRIRSTVTLSNEPSISMVRRLGYKEKRLILEKELD